MGGGRTRARTWDPLIKSQLVFKSAQGLSQTKSVKPATNGQWVSSDLSNLSGALGRVALAFVIVWLGLCASCETSHADLYYESSINEWCRPASPTTQNIVRWRQPNACTNDCFVWRLTCSNGRHYDLQSKFNPAITNAQAAFYEWAPWSFLLYLLPFIALVGLATLGVQRLALLLFLDGIALTYAVVAAWCFYNAVTGNPWGPTVAFERAVFLNPYVYFAVIGLTALLNLPAVWRGLEALFYRHPVETTTVPVIWPGDPGHAAAMSAALMPSLHEFLDPGHTAAHYRRETEHMRALKEKFDAQTSLAEAIIRRERWRNQFND